MYTSSCTSTSSFPLFSHNLFSQEHIVDRIVRPASWKWCLDCGRHGQIVYSDGSMSRSLHTTEDLIVELSISLAIGKIVKEECKPLFAEAVLRLPTPDGASLMREDGGLIVIEEINMVVVQPVLTPRRPIRQPVRQG